jgi:hypothetical protein
LELSVSICYSAGQAPEGFVNLFLQCTAFLAFISGKGGALNRRQDFAITRARVSSDQVGNGGPCVCKLEGREVRDLKEQLPVDHTNKHLQLSSAYLTRFERPFKVMLVESMASLKPSDLGK